MNFKTFTAIFIFLTSSPLLATDGQSPNGIGTITASDSTGGLVTDATPTTKGRELPFETSSFSDLDSKAVCLHVQCSTTTPCKIGKELMNLSVKTDADNVGNLFDLSTSMYGKEDVKNSATFLQNIARYMYGDISKSPICAEEALYNSEANIKMLIYLDKKMPLANHRPLLPDFEKKATILVHQAEGLFSKKDYLGMRNTFYQALWIVYPVTSEVPFQAVK